MVTPSGPVVKVTLVDRDPTGAQTDFGSLGPFEIIGAFPFISLWRLMPVGLAIQA
jgi:hypothetical protein